MPRPILAVPALIALCTDPFEETRRRALGLLRTLCEQHSRFLDADRLCSGVVEAYAFRAALSKVGVDGAGGLVRQMRLFFSCRQCASFPPRQQTRTQRT